MTPLTGSRADVQAENVVRTVAGTGVAGYSGDGGPATSATLDEPAHCSFGTRGEMYIAEAANHTVRRVDPDGTIRTVAGCGRKGYGGDGGPATKALLNEPYGVFCGRNRDLYIVDRLNACVRRVDGKSGIISTIAGTGKPGYSGDGGPAVAAQMKEPHGFALDTRGEKLFIADVADCRIRMLDLKTGTISTVAGNGRRAFSGDGGPATEASIQGARAVAVAGDGTLYICEREGNRLRRVDPRTHVIKTIAGTGKSGFRGGDPLQAEFNGPKWVALDERGDLFIVDTENHAVWRLEAKASLLQVVMGGQRGTGGDGDAPLRAQLDRPHGCCVYRGKLYVADSLNHRVLVCRVPPSSRQRP